MTCAEGEDKLNAALDGELSAQERGELDAHLAGCAECRRTEDALRQQSLELESAFEAPRARAAAQADRIAARVRELPLPRRRFRAAALIALAAAILVALAFGSWRMRPPAPSPVPAGVLVEATGPVEVERKGGWSPIRPGEKVEVGDLIRTAPHSKCEWAAQDGTLIRLSTSTLVSVERPRAVDLREGELWARVALGTSPFEVRTPGGRFETMGATFDLSCQPPQPPLLDRAADLVVVEGQGWFSFGVDRRQVPAPMSCAVASGRCQIPERAEPLLRTGWTHDLIKLRPKDDPEFVSLVKGLVAGMDRTETADGFEREIRSLGSRGVPTLLALVKRSPQDFGPSERRHAARILSELAGPSEVSDLVALVHDPDEQVSGFARKALSRVTGVYEKGRIDWDRWLRDHRERWPAPRDPLEEAPPKKG